MRMLKQTQQAQITSKSVITIGLFSDSVGDGAFPSIAVKYPNMYMYLLQVPKFRVNTNVEKQDEIMEKPLYHLLNGFGIGRL